jgi:hypothetical protein
VVTKEKMDQLRVPQASSARALFGQQCGHKLLYPISQSAAVGLLANKACTLTSDGKGKDGSTQGVSGIICKSFVWSTAQTQTFASDLTKYSFGCSQQSKLGS